MIKNILFLLIFITAYGCLQEDVEITELEFTEISDVLNSADSKRGERLYQKQCMNCHGELLDSNVRKSTKGQITIAVKNISNMQFLVGSLTEADIADIVLALNPVSSCFNGEVLRNGKCIEQLCVPKSKIYETCSKENAIRSEITSTCSDDGLKIKKTACEVKECFNGYKIESNECVLAGACIPGEKQIVSCAAENAKDAKYESTCNGSGDGYTYSSCVIEECDSGFKLEAGKCELILIPADEKRGISLYNNNCVNCHNAYLNTDVKFKTAEELKLAISNIPAMSMLASLSEQDILDVELALNPKEECFTGYFLDTDNICKPMICNPNESSSVECEAQYAEEATVEKICNNNGSDYSSIGQCEIKKCLSGYYLSGNLCIPENVISCTPGVTDRVSCNKPNAIKSTRERICQVDGGSYSYGECEIEQCDEGFEVIEKECVPKLLPGNIEKGKTVYQNRCLKCHGSFLETEIPGKTYDQIELALDSVTDMASLKPMLTRQDIADLEAALNNGLKNDNGRKVFACSDQTALAIEHTNRLSDVEYKNTLTNLMDGIDVNLKNETSIQSALLLIPSDYSEETGKTNVSNISASHVESYFEVANAISEKIATDANYLHKLPGEKDCFQETSISTNCLKSFIEDFGLKVYRRPLDGSEVSELLSSVEANGLTSKENKVQFTIMTLLSSPHFMYHLRVNGSDIDSDSIKLSQYELASKISYLLTGTMPDDVLFSRVKEGSLLTKESISFEIMRLLEKEGAKTQITNFFKEWFQYNKNHKLIYNEHFLDGISLVDLEYHAQTEIKKIIEEVVIREKGTFEDLIMTNKAYVTDNNFGKIYTINSTNGFTTLPESERTGLFSRVAFLYKSGSTNTSPIHRGVFMLDKVLCQKIGTPPDLSMIEDNSSDGESSVNEGPITYRQAVEKTTEDRSTSCFGCHSKINPLGYAFENFDGLGRLRSEEKKYDSNGTFLDLTLTIDPSTSSTELNGENVSINGAENFHQILSNSDQALSCMAKKYYEYANKRQMVRNDNCHVNKMLETLYGENGKQKRIIDMIDTYINSYQFQHKKYK